MWRSTGTTARTRCRCAMRRTTRGFSSAPSPSAMWAGAFPTAASASTPCRGPGIERVGGDELLFADGRSRGQPFLCLLSEPARSIGFRITGRLVPESEAELLPEERYWSQITAGLRLDPPVGSPLAEETARLAEILPWLAHNALIHYLSPARSGAVFRRRLGHPRRHPGAGGDAAGPRPSRARPRSSAARVQAAESRRGLAAMVHVLRAGARHPARRFPRRHRLLAPAGPGPVPAGLGRCRAPGRGPSPSSIPKATSRRSVAPIRQHLERALGVIRNRRIPDTELAAYGTATGTTRCSRSTPPCASACAAPGP